MITWAELEARWPGIGAAWDAAYGDSVAIIRIAVCRVRGPRMQKVRRGQGCVEQAVALVEPCDFRRYDADLGAWLSSSWEVEIEVPAVPAEQAEVDAIYVSAGVVTPEEVAMSRYSGLRRRRPAEVRRCFGPSWGNPAGPNPKGSLVQDLAKKLPFEVQPDGSARGMYLVDEVTPQ